MTGRGISISGGKVYQREHHPHAVTGADGRFSFSPPIEDFRIVALHDEGYGEATGSQFASTHELKLRPWGRIEGTLRVGGKPLANEPVRASLDDVRVDPDWPIIQNESRAMTDENGRFLIDRLAPGEACVYWQPESASRSRSPSRYYQPAFVNVEAGRLAHVDLVQAGGRPVIGRLALPDDEAAIPQDATWDAYITLKLPEPPYPAELSPSARERWLSRWRLSEAGTRYRRSQRGFAHSLRLAPDRSFRVDEVQVGRYELHVRVRARCRGGSKSSPPSRTNSAWRLPRPRRRLRWIWAP